MLLLALSLALFFLRYFLPGAGVEAGQAVLEVEVLAEAVLAAEEAVLAVAAAVILAAAEVQETGKMKTDNNFLGSSQ